MTETKHFPEILRLQKVDAAVRQTEAAIQSFFHGDFDIAITLAGAAEGMLSDLANGSVFRDIVDKAVTTGRWSEKDFVTELNFERDWLKHPTPGKPAEITISRMEAAYMCIRAIGKLPDANETEGIRDFKVWYLDFVRPTK